MITLFNPDNTLNPKCLFNLYESDDFDNGILYPIFLASQKASFISLTAAL